MRIEAHADLILDAVARKSDITLAELRGLLSEKGVHVAVSTLWRFFDRRRITLKKRLRTQKVKKDCVCSKTLHTQGVQKD